MRTMGSGVTFLSFWCVGTYSMTSKCYVARKGIGSSVTSCDSRWGGESKGQFFPLRTF